MDEGRSSAGRPLPSGARIAPEALSAVLRAQAEARASEPCGLLVGGLEGRILVVIAAPQAANVHETPSRAFRIAGDELLKLTAQARAVGRSICGTWHGHLRGAAWPGKSDVASMQETRAVTEVLGETPWLHLVIGRGSGGRPVVRAFFAGERRLRETHLRRLD